MDEDEILSYGLDFVNEALSDLGQTDLLTGLSKTAEDPRERRCAISYAKTRLMVLSQVEWNFARTLMACASTQTGAIGNTEYPFVTPLPGDCVRLLGAFTRDGEEPIREVYDDMIHSAEPLVTLSYIRDVEDPHDWSERARGLLVLALAAAYAKIIKGSSSELQIREQLYQNALQEAVLENAKENKRPKQHVGGNFYGDVLRGIATASNDKDRAREIMVPMQGTSRIYQALTQEMTERKLADASLISDLDTETLARIEAIQAEAMAREKADTVEADTRAHAISAEATAREEADAAEAKARKEADEAEAAAREEADKAEATAREEADTAEAEARTQAVADALTEAQTFATDTVSTAIANVFNGTTTVTLGANTYRAEASADGETLIFKKVTE